MNEIEDARADVDNWTEITRDLRGQLDAVNANLGDVAGRRRALVLPARLKQGNAAEQLAALDTEVVGLEREAADLGQALEDAEATLANAEARLAEAEAQERRRRCAELDAAAGKEAADIDAGLAGIAKSAGRVRELLQEADRLRDEGAQPKAGLVGDLAASSHWRGALSYHGLSGAHDCHSAYRRPLAEAIGQ